MQEQLCTGELLQGLPHIEVISDGAVRSRGITTSPPPTPLEKQTRTASHRSGTMPQRCQQLRAHPGDPGGLPTPLHPRSPGGPGSAKRRRFQRGFPGRKTRRGPAEERGGLPAPLRCKSGGGAGAGGGGEGKKRRRRRRRGRLLPAEERPGPAPVRPVGPRGGAPGSCSGRSESFCVQVAERRGLFALQQLSHYLH